MRAKMVEQAGGSAWSSFACRGMGQSDDLLEPLAPYEALVPFAAVRHDHPSS